MKNVINFNLIKINRDAQKICKCNPPNYELDIKNRLVKCTKCGAYTHPFDALLYLAENLEKYKKIEKEIIKRIHELNEKCNKLSRKKLKLSIFKDMEKAYIDNLLPVCPECKKPFKPTDISSYHNKNYI